MQRKDIVFEYTKQEFSHGKAYSLYVKGEPRFSIYMDYEDEDDFSSQIRGCIYAAQVLGFNVTEIVEVV